MKSEENNDNNNNNNKPITTTTTSLSSSSSSNNMLKSNHRHLLSIPKNGIRGISFDVEKTLLSTKGMKLSEHYAVAFHTWNDKNANTPEKTLEPPKWMIENDSKRRNNQLGEAWLRATHERNIARGLVDEDINVNKGDDEEIEFNNNVLCEAYAGSSFPLVVDEFYFLVMKYFFELTGADENDDQEKLLREFTNYCVHDYWVSTAAYSLPHENAEKLIELVEKFPDLSLFVVSNTDDRCIPAVHLFPMYQKFFGRQDQFVTATNVTWVKPGDSMPSEKKDPRVLNKEKNNKNINEKYAAIEKKEEEEDEANVLVPALKPYPHGIFWCRNKCGFNKEQQQKWLHVGDDMEADGGAALNSESLFLLCDGKKGVDFGKVIEVLESADPMSTANQATQEILRGQHTPTPASSAAKYAS